MRKPWSHGWRIPCAKWLKKPSQNAGAFHLVLAGGSTPKALYRALAARGAGDARWHLWYGDERCLPPDHPERNSYMLETAWLACVAYSARKSSSDSGRIGGRASGCHFTPAALRKRG